MYDQQARDLINTVKKRCPEALVYMCHDSKQGPASREIAKLGNEMANAIMTRPVPKSHLVKELDKHEQTKVCFFFLRFFEI